MLSTTFQRYPDHFYHDMATQHHGLDTLASTAHLQQMQQQQIQQQQSHQQQVSQSRPPMKHRASYGAESMNGSVQGEKKVGRSASSNQPVRRRISRACDQVRPQLRAHYV
jgi:hypothetical protein